MFVMNKHTFILVLSSLCAVSAALSFCQGKPQFIHQTWPLSSPAPLQTVTFEVSLDQVVSGTQVVNLSTSTPSRFTSFPSSVTVTNGNSTATFQATLSSAVGGGLQVEASCNGESAGYEIAVVEPPK